MLNNTMEAHGTLSQSIWVYCAHVTSKLVFELYCTLSTGLESGTSPMYVENQHWVGIRIGTKSLPFIKVVLKYHNRGSQVLKWMDLIHRCGSQTKNKNKNKNSKRLFLFFEVYYI